MFVFLLSVPIYTSYHGLSLRLNSGWLGCTAFILILISDVMVYFTRCTVNMKYTPPVNLTIVSLFTYVDSRFAPLALQTEQVYMYILPSCKIYLASCLISNEICRLPLINIRLFFIFILYKLTGLIVIRCN